MSKEEETTEKKIASRALYHLSVIEYKIMSGDLKFEDCKRLIGYLQGLASKYYDLSTEDLQKGGNYE